MENTYTWVNLASRSSSTANIRHAVSAAVNSPLPTRTVVATRDWPENQTLIDTTKHPLIRAFCLAKIQVGEGDVLNQNPRESSDRNPPTGTIVLYVIENTLAPDFDNNTLRTDLSELNPQLHTEYYGKPTHYQWSGPIIPHNYQRTQRQPYVLPSHGMATQPP
jgi:hypothetical protein